MRAGFWFLGKWRGAPLLFHWTILLWLPWYIWKEGSVAWAIGTLLAFVALLSAHEMGHAFAARSRRLKVEAIRLYVLHGQCEYEHPYNEADDVFVAWGGVLAQFVVLVLALAGKHTCLLLWPPLAFTLEPLFSVFISVNIFLGAINLIPVSPLDGHKAWRVIPLLRERLKPRYTALLRAVGSALNFKKHRAMKKKSERATAELLDRLKKK
jgi:Zn-dependent protease